MMWGGWGNGVVPGGAGNSAISGAEAPTLGYTDNFNMYGNETATAYMTTQIADTVLTDYVLNKVPVETDFFHPYNPGNAAAFMPNTDPPHGNSGRGFNIGKSLYFNAEDVRRQIQLFPTVIDPTVVADGLTPAGMNPLDCEWTGAIGSAFADSTTAGLPFFMTFNQVDANLPIDAVWNKPAAFLPDPVTGDKSLVGDLGNDYIVAGMGRVRVYGGGDVDLLQPAAAAGRESGAYDTPAPHSPLPPRPPAWAARPFGRASPALFF